MIPVHQLQQQIEALQPQLTLANWKTLTHEERVLLSDSVRTIREVVKKQLSTIKEASQSCSDNKDIETLTSLNQQLANLRPPHPIHVTLFLSKSKEGRTADVEVENSATALDFKKGVAETFKVPLESIKAIHFAGRRVLSDDNDVIISIADITSYKVHVFVDL